MYVRCKHVILSTVDRHKIREGSERLNGYETVEIINKYNI